MPKSFHTFFSGDADLQNNVFYSGTMNPLIKDMLLQNVKKICNAEDSRGDSLSQLICAVSSECLETLNTISRIKQDKHPVLFNLQRFEGNCQLNLGVRIAKQEAVTLKRKIKELRRESETVAKRKIYEHLKQIKIKDERTAGFFPLLSLAINSKRRFEFHFEAFSETEIFLTIRLELDKEND